METKAVIELPFGVLLVHSGFDSPELAEEFAIRYPAVSLWTVQQIAEWKGVIVNIPYKGD